MHSFPVFTGNEHMLVPLKDYYALPRCPINQALPQHHFSALAWSWHTRCIVPQCFSCLGMSPAMQARYHPVLRTGSTLDSATIIYRYLPCCCVLQVRPVNSGTATLKDATSEAIRDLVTNIETTHYILGSAAGPHPCLLYTSDAADE